ncbi:MAG: trypsin-like peptidase protein [Flavipsychrobacter sp.]|jgi:S1-C subfamily serine protease|nr:trypsin-like peptidase protein [Flavipsychrobacter sp.]
MSTENNIWKLAEAYVEQTLAEAELVQLKNRLASDSAFAEEFHECVNMIRSLGSRGKQVQFRSLLADIHGAQKQVPAKRTAKGYIMLMPEYWRTAAVAAGIAILTSLSTYWLVQNNNKKIASQYSLLKRDLEKYKRSQHQLINNIKAQAATTPTATVRYTGTGFALTNDGYLVTNYHVTEGADSIYIQNREGEYFKATVKSIDPAADIAILKVDYKNFRFSKHDVPYTFEKTKKGLGARVYTMGYPQDEIVYNEGYISSKNGFGGDSMQYMLELPANPGQSGAPVIDADGNVIAIITGKQTETEGTTYAVSSKALVQLIRNLPAESRLRLPKVNKLGGLSREQQIERLEDYTCSIKVYKK